MSLWQNILTGILILVLTAATLGVLLASLLHVRFEAAWFGVWQGDIALPHEKFLRLEYGFPGFMRTRTLTGDGAQTRGEERGEERGDARGDPSRGNGADEADGTKAAGMATSQNPEPHDLPESHKPGEGLGGEPGAAQAAAPGAKARARETRSQRPPMRHEKRARARGGKGGPGAKDPHRHRKALFRFFTDGTAWRLASGYFLRVAIRAFRLPGLHVELVVGHPDPAWLGRFAGHWYAASPLLPRERAIMNFRFQDRHPSLGARARGGFSLLAFLWFLAMIILTFPWFRLGRRAWFLWRHGELDGWRAWSYRKIQTL